MPLPPKLEHELDELRGQHKIEVTEEPDLINIVFLNLHVGEGYRPTNCDLLLRIPRSYPDAGPDMFWTAPEVLLANSRVPQAADVIETYLGRRWRRFSWHRPPTSPWNPTVDNLHSHLEFIRKRLRENR